MKQTALEIAAAIRPANKFKRVGMSFVERIEAKVRAAMHLILAHPPTTKRYVPGLKITGIRSYKGLSVELAGLVMIVNDSTT